MAQLNVINLSTSSNAMIQDNPDELSTKNAVHIQRKNCGSRNTEINHVIILINGDMIGEVGFK